MNPPLPGLRPVVPLLRASDDRALVSALREGRDDARAELYRRYAQDARRVLVRIVGANADVVDLIQDVFLRAFEKIGALDDPDRLRSWIIGISVRVAREHLRRLSRRRWLPWTTEHEPVAAYDDVGAEALARTYRVLDALAVDERVAFALRYVDGMELLHAADACDVSLSTFKRRLGRAEERFRELASRDPVLATRLQTGRWETT